MTGYLVKPFPTRIVPSGTVSINAGQSLSVPGTNLRQDRVRFTVTNLDAALAIKLQSTNQANFATVFPQQSHVQETTADFLVQNPNGQAVSVEICELYPDEQRVAALMAQAAAAGGGAGGSAPDSNTPSGGYNGGGRNTQPR